MWLAQSHHLVSDSYHVCIELLKGLLFVLFAAVESPVNPAWSDWDLPPMKRLIGPGRQIQVLCLRNWRHPRGHHGQMRVDTCSSWSVAGLETNEEWTSKKHLLTKRSTANVCTATILEHWRHLHLWNSSQRLQWRTLQSEDHLTDDWNNIKQHHVSQMSVIVYWFNIFT